MSLRHVTFLATLKQCRTYTKEKMAAGKLLAEIWELRMST